MLSPLVKQKGIWEVLLLSGMIRFILSVKVSNLLQKVQNRLNLLPNNFLQKISPIFLKVLCELKKYLKAHSPFCIQHCK